MAWIEAEWALWGKPPGERDDYSVTAASRGRYQPAQFKEIIARFTPGTPDSPEALPRVTLSWVGANDDAHLGLAIQTWTGDKDGVGRDIAETRYFCVPYRQLSAHPVSYVELYEALKDLSPRDHGSQPIRVQVPELDPGRLAADIAALGEQTVRETAALLLIPRRAVCVVRAEQTKLLERLRFLDAVISLLPYGYRTRFTASTWTNSATRHRIRLSFARRARDETQPVIWRGSGHVPHDEAAAFAYLERLDALLTGGREPSWIIGRLAAEIEPRRFEDSTHAVQALERLERPRLVIERIRADDGDPAEVRELLDSGQIIDLEPDDRRKALGYLIGLGEHEDFPRIEHWLPIIAKGDPALLVDSLIDTAKRLLWAPSSRRVRHYLVWAERLACTDRFLAGLILSPARREDLEGGLYGLAEMLYEEVIATGQTSEYGQSLVALSQNPAAVCELIARLAEGRAPHLRSGLDWLTPVKPELTHPFHMVLARSPRAPSRGDIEILAGYGRNCVRALLGAACHRRRLHLVLQPFIEWLNTRGPLRPDEQSYWAERLGDLNPDDPAMRGALDVLRLATAALPNAMMNVATRDWAHYADGFVNHWEIEVWNPGNRAHLLSGMSTYLRGMRWQIHSGRADDVLSLTERLTERAAPQDAAQLIQALVTSLSEAPDLTSDPDARDWLDRMRRQYPPETVPRTKFMEPPPVRPHGSAAPPLYPPARLGDEVETVVGRCIAAFHHGQPFEWVLDGLARTQAIASGTSALQVVGRLYDGLITFGTPREVAYDWAMALADRVVGGEFGQEVAADFHREVRRSSLFEAMFRINLIATVADQGMERPLDLTDDDRRHLKEIRDHTDLMLKKSTQTGSRWARRPAILRRGDAGDPERDDRI
ncbi:hypothetical protein [Actinoallomurus vinaceus]|uniref:hypothetical protein n=1 Tax=Actinoallomurus vinaceus TaxID=1080074 RepID=UPI0031E5817E